jgi:hypothetical protein
MHGSLHRYSEDFGGREQVMLWLLGVLPEAQREALEALLERRRGECAV